MRICLLFLFLFIAVHSSIGQKDSLLGKIDSAIISLDIGGALRFNYNLSSWKPNQKKRGGDFGFEVFRINVDAVYKKYEFHIDQRFYSKEFGGAFMKYGWFQYNFNDKHHIKLGLIPAYFGTQQFNSHSWFFQLPFYLGFEDDHDMGISYDYKSENFQVDIGFYKNAETLTFDDNSPVSNSRYSYDFSGNNKEINQGNIRFNYFFGSEKSHTLGASLQLGGIWNIDHEDVGLHRAFDFHYQYDKNQLNFQLQYINFDNQPTDDLAYIEMTAYGFPYNTAAKGAFYTIGIAYSLPVKWGPISSLQFYNDYAILKKDKQEWEDSQMNVTGILVSAKPIFVYIDYAMGKHQPWLGPQWSDALTTGDSNNSWESRFNVNLGYYF